MKSIIRTISAFQWIVVLLIIAWLGWAVTVLWPEGQLEATVKLSYDPDCDLRKGPCISRLPNGKGVSFAIEPRSIPLLEELQLEVRTSDQSIEKVSVDINGIEMNMGINQAQLEPLGNGRYTGKADLSVCIHEVMEWEAKVFLHQAKQVIEVPFRFITVKD